MYNPEGADSGYEWVEVLNTSADKSVTVVGGSVSGSWRFWDGSNHLIGQSAYQGDMVLDPGEYAVFVQDPPKFLSKYSFSGSIIKVGAMSLGNDPNDAGEEVGLRIGSEDSLWSLVKYFKGWGGDGDGTTIGLIDGAWKKTEPTQGAGNHVAQNPESPSSPQPSPSETVSFSAPSSVSAGSEFTVTVNLSNFKSGSYYVKVLVGKGDKFYDGRTYGTNGVWLAWNAGWSDFPKISIDSSGSASKTVKAETDGDISGGYEIKVRTYDDKNTCDSQVKNISIKAAPKVVSATSEASGGSTADVDDGMSSDPAALESPSGEVLGEKDSSPGGFKLNFYLVTGIFGLLVGGAGLFFSFRYLP